MRFAILGTHPDGLALAEALAASGRHELAAYSTDEPRLRALAGQARRVGDAEEILADPAVEAVIVAGPLDARPALLRRALQSERHVLCVHPAGDGPEIAYEAGMIRDDTRCVLLPILTEALYPAVRRLAEFVRRDKGDDDSPTGQFLLLEVERPNGPPAGDKAAFPGWDVLRAIGGEVAELSAFAAAEEAGADEAVLVAGTFEHGGLFQATLLPPRDGQTCRLTVVGRRCRAELLFPVGPDGPAFLDWRDASGGQHEEHWDAQDLWPVLVSAFEEAVASRPPALSWQDEVRALELDDAARRSLARRRTSLLEYPEATEEVGFKGTMTLVGCGVLWAVLLLVILSVWVPRLGWAVVPLLAIFLVLQFLRYALPQRNGD
jgi:myo-inositol 2-dehydrogenase/D-chiro-inositol 1-dehydrogenase